MTAPKYAKRIDAVQPEIVKQLRQAGVSVEIIGYPTDLLCWHPSFGQGVFKLLELKSGEHKRRDQPAQDRFCADHGVKRVTTAAEALDALQLSVGGLAS